MLGELFLYLKKLEAINWPQSRQNSSNLQILGLEDLDLYNLKHLPNEELNLYLKDQFINNYAQILVQKGLDNLANFWYFLTRVKLDFEQLRPKTEFQKKVINWLQSKQREENLIELLKHDYLFDKSEDLALAYGLQVLRKLNNLDKNSDSKIELLHNFEARNQTNLENVSFEISKKAEVLVIGPKYLAPLFLQLNFLFVDKNEQNLEQDLNNLLSSNQFKIVLVIDLELIKISQLESLTNLPILHLKVDSLEEDYFGNLIKNLEMGS